MTPQRFIQPQAGTPVPPPFGSGANVALFERRTYQFIGLYRYFGFALAVGLEAVWPRLQGETVPDRVFFILGLIGLLTIYKIFWPRYDLWGMNPNILGVAETVAILALALWNGGLNSGLLLYSLTPIIAYALLYEVKMPLVLAMLPGSAMLLAHLLLSRWTTAFPHLLVGNYMILFLLYAAVTFLIVLIPQRVNITVLRRLDEETVSRERRKLSWEIHDSLAQSLAYLSMQIRRTSEKMASGDYQGALAVLGETEKDAHEAYDQTREAIDFLRLEQSRGSLLGALPEYVRDFSRRCGLKAEVEMPLYNLRLSRDVELQLLGIIQGALSNVRKHAGASSVLITITPYNSSINVTIRDDGRGFPAETPIEYSSHGLNIMRERAAAIGADLSIESAPQRGTEVKITLPTIKYKRGRPR